MEKSGYIFLSYSRKNSKFALQLAEDLRENGFKVWMDQSDIEGGRHWDNRIEDALKNASFVVLVVSPSSAVSENVQDEVSFAKKKKVHIIPVVHKETEIPMRWHRLQFIDMQKKYEFGLKTLLDTLNGLPIIIPPTGHFSSKFMLYIGILLSVLGIIALFLYQFYLKDIAHESITDLKNLAQSTKVIYKGNTIVIGNGNKDINITQE